MTWNFNIGTFFCLTISGVTLAGCGSNSLPSETTASGVRAVSGGEVNAELASERNDSVSNASVGTIAYVTGLNQNTGQAAGYAGIAPGANVGNAVTSGTASYATRYEYDVIDNVVRTTGTIGGDRASESGTLTLNADFGSGTLTGSNSELVVNGTVNGTTLGGTVTASYSSLVLIGDNVNGTVDGVLAGDVGSTGVIGAFHGTDSNTVLAGGIVGTSN